MGPFFAFAVRFRKLGRKLADFGGLFSKTDAVPQAHGWARR